MLLNTKFIRLTFHRLLHSPALKVFLISLSCWLLTFAYCKGRYWRDPHSAFFNSDHVYDLKYSAFREGQANAFVDVASRPETTLKKASPNPEICAAFVTVRREGKNYFEGAVGSMLQGLADEEREKLFLYVLFANTDPAVHPSWNSTWLNNAVDLFESYDVSNLTMGQMQVLEEERNFAEKGVYDYLYVLSKCYDSEAPYVAILEDDIMMADGWMARTLSAVQKIKEQAASGKRPWKNWFYLRLFYTETSQYWRTEDDFWYRNIWLTLALASLSGFVLLVGTRLFVPRTRKVLDNYAVATICVITIPAFIALVFMIGKSSLLYSHHGVFALNKYACCTQGLVFPREQVPDMIHYLRERQAGQTDVMLEEYADVMGKQRIAIFPQVVQHVGLVSSRDNNFINGKSTWAFWFEESDPDKLAKEHKKLLEDKQWLELKKAP